MMPNRDIPRFHLLLLVACSLLLISMTIGCDNGPPALPGCEQCEDTQYCKPNEDRAGGSCVTCLVDGHCKGADERCYENSCVPNPDNA